MFLVRRYDLVSDTEMLYIEDLSVYCGVMINIMYGVVFIVQGKMVCLFYLCIFVQKRFLYTHKPKRT